MSYYLELTSFTESLFVAKRTAKSQKEVLLKANFYHSWYLIEIINIYMVNFAGTDYIINIFRDAHQC